MSPAAAKIHSVFMKSMDRVSMVVAIVFIAMAAGILFIFLLLSVNALIHTFTKGESPLGEYSSLTTTELAGRIKEVGCRPIGLTGTTMTVVSADEVFECRVEDADGSLRWCISTR